jgi:RNA polymerase sigma-70 factor (ECF subfamily)
MTASTVRLDPEQRVCADRLGRLFTEHQLRLYRLARRMSKDPEEARDLVQETFVRLARQRRAPAGNEAQVEGWLVKTMINLCRDRDRKNRVRGRYVAEGASLQPAVSKGHEGAVVARVVVASALARLSSRRRAVVVLFEIEGRSSAEIARLLGISAVTVRWHLHSARRDLKKMLSPQGASR